MQVAIEGLRDGAVLDGTGDLDAFDLRLRRAMRRSTLASGTAIALTIGGYIAWAYRSGRLDQIEGMAGGEVALFALMVGVCVLAGAVAGYLLGSLFGQPLKGSRRTSSSQRLRRPVRASPRGPGDFAASG